MTPPVSEAVPISPLQKWATTMTVKVIAHFWRGEIGTASDTGGVIAQACATRGQSSRYARRAVPLNSASFSSAEARAAMRLNAFHRFWLMSPALGRADAAPGSCHVRLPVVMMRLGDDRDDAL